MRGISLRLGVIWFCATTVFCTLGWLAMSYWFSPHRFFPEEEFRLPWLHGWEVGLFIGFLLGLVTGVFATFHPLRKSVLKKERV